MKVPKRKKENNNFLPVDYHLSLKKYQELKQKLDYLKKQHPKEAAEVKRLAEMGDFSENAGYQLAKSRLRNLNQRILNLENLLKRAEIITSDPDTSRIKIGHRVTILHAGIKKQYTILSSNESDPINGVISHNSPLGSALIGKKIGEEVKIEINGKEKNYKIIDIEMTSI